MGFIVLVSLPATRSPTAPSGRYFRLRFRGFGLDARWYTVPLKLDSAA